MFTAIFFSVFLKKCYEFHDLNLRTKNKNGEWGKAVKVNQFAVVTNADDSEQVAADLTLFKDKILVGYIRENKKSVYVTELDKDLQILKHTEIISGANASWIRGRIITLKDGKYVYAMVVDEGSKGGSGYNKFLLYPLN